MTKLFVHAKLLIDGISATPKFDQLISIEDDKIKAIEDYHEIHEDVIEVNTITPGFFNCHVHILYPVGFDSKKEFSLIEKIFYAQKHCKDYLESGVTFIRVVGTEENYDLQIKEAIQNDVIQGPHMYCAGKVICMTGGHGWQEGIEADGKDGCLKAVRTQLKSGVDLIKMMATGGVMTKGVEPGNAQFSVEEMKVMIEEAHKAGRKAATHAQGLQGIKNALYAGIDSIEHGCFLDEECLELMKKQNTFLVPTLCAPQCISCAAAGRAVFHRGARQRLRGRLPRAAAGTRAAARVPPGGGILRHGERTEAGAALHIFLSGVRQRFLFSRRTARGV